MSLARLMMITEKIFGRMCRYMMRIGLAPIAWAATMYSRPRCESVSPRTKRIVPVQDRKASIRISDQTVGFNIAEMISSRKKLGIEFSVMIAHIDKAELTALVKPGDHAQGRPNQQRQRRPRDRNA